MRKAYLEFREKEQKVLEELQAKKMGTSPASSPATSGNENNDAEDDGGDEDDDEASGSEYAPDDGDDMACTMGEPLDSEVTPDNPAPPEHETGSEEGGMAAPWTSSDPPAVGSRKHQRCPICKPRDMTLR